jgi:hypothetical protein
MRSKLDTQFWQECLLQCAVWDGSHSTWAIACGRCGIDCRAQLQNENGVGTGMRERRMTSSLGSSFCLLSAVWMSSVTRCRDCCRA